MPELAEVETPKTAGFVDRGYNHAKRKQRMEDEAKEIAKLEAEARGETPVDEAEEVEETTQEAETNTEVKEETLSALEVLGYSRRVSEKVIDNLIQSDPESSIETLIKLALNKL